MYEGMDSHEGGEESSKWSAGVLERSVADQSQLHILCVDDDKDSLEITTFALKQAGANVTSVSSGAEALQAMGQLVPDVLISDLGMPDMDGYTLIQKVRALPKGKGREVKAIALTAYVDQKRIDRAIAAGFQQYLAKPVEIKALVQSVRQLVASE